MDYTVHWIFQTRIMEWVMEEPGGLQSVGSLRVGHDCATSLSLFHFHALENEMATHFSVLAWRIPGMGEPSGLLSIGLHRVRHDWSDLVVAAAAFLFSRGSFQPKDLPHSNPGLPHCRQILYQLSSQGTPIPTPGHFPDPGITLGFPTLQGILYQLSYQESPIN